MTDLSNFSDNSRSAIIGASGGIGSALTNAVSESDKFSAVYALSRSGKAFDNEKITPLEFDFSDETSIKAAAETIDQDGKLDLVIVAAGFLHGESIGPEKQIGALSYDGFEKNFAVNTIGPAMTGKYFLDLMRTDRHAVFAAISARVGSISDNRIGGWYAYRASKAALNMIIRNFWIERSRKHDSPVIIGLHPGTVDTPLSEPFQSNVPEGKLFTPEYSAEKLLGVVNSVTAERGGTVIDWDNETVQP